MSSYANEKDELLDLLYRSQDSPLTPGEQQLLDTGLEQYRWLREEQVILTKLRLALSDLHSASSPDFVDSVLISVRAEKHLLRPLLVQWRAVAAAACLALLIGGGVIYNSSGNWETEAILGLEEMEAGDVYAFDE